VVLARAEPVHQVEQGLAVRRDLLAILADAEPGVLGRTLRNGR
jgi:hypothetical protein